MEIRTEKIWMNGSLINWEDAKIHVLTHALHYGTGAFEGIRFYETTKGAAIFRLTDHIARLEKSFSFIDKMPFSAEQLCEASKQVVRANNLKEGYLRPIVFLGLEKMGLDFRGTPVNTVIATWPWKKYFGSESIGVNCKTSVFERPRNKAYPSQAKLSGKYINSVMAKIDAVSKGYNEAIMLNHSGFVSEGPGENLFIISDGIITSPGLEADALEGITRNSIITIAKDFGYKIKDRFVTKDMLFSADEAFFTGTAAEIMPVISVDDKVIGSGKIGHVTEKLQSTFFNVVHGNNEKYVHWLDVV